MRRLLIVVRATGLAWSYAVTLGLLLLVRLEWTDGETHSGALGAWMQSTAKTAWFVSPYVALTATLFTLISAPLAAWAIGEASWSSLKRYVYSFWFVVAFLVVASGDASVLILASGAGLIRLWLLRHRESLNLTKIFKREREGIHTVLRKEDFTRNISGFAVLAAIAFVLFLWLAFGRGTKTYVFEIFSIYAAAVVCEGVKWFAGIYRYHPPKSELLK